MAKCMYNDCSKEATHVLVDQDHQKSAGREVFCALHAFKDGRKKCPCCSHYTIEFTDDLDQAIDLLPTYSNLGGDGCCSEHP